MTDKPIATFEPESDWTIAESWSHADVRRARREIEDHFPGANFSVLDYGLSLRVKHPKADMAIIVYQASRPDHGQIAIVTRVPVVLEWMATDPADFGAVYDIRGGK